jgi:hypothetical protein
MMAAIVAPWVRNRVGLLGTGAHYGGPDARADLRDFADRAGVFFGNSSAPASVALSSSRIA